MCRFQSISLNASIQLLYVACSGELGPWEIRIFINQPVMDLSKSNFVVDGGEVVELNKVKNGNYLANITAFSSTRALSVTMLDVRGKACSTGFTVNTLAAVLSTGKIQAYSQKLKPIQPVLSVANFATNYLAQPVKKKGNS